MSKRNPLLDAPPYPVEQTLKKLGANLRTARIRRGLTIKQISQKIGTGVRAVADAEKGKPSTGIVTYLTMLWALDLLGQMEEVASPQKDQEGQMLALIRESKRARKTTKEDDNDF